MNDLRLREASVGRMPKLVSIIIPAYNEAEGIVCALKEISRVLDSCQFNWEIILIDDGSTDGTFAQLHDLRDRRIKGIRLSRNFGKESALLAGLRLALGEVVITMDADLQHPPILIPSLFKKWQEGAMIVHAVKRNRQHDGWLRRARAAVFNSIMNRLCGSDLQGGSDFKLLDRMVVDAVAQQCTERTRFYRGLTNWVGYPQARVFFDVAKRIDGHGSWSTKELIKLATTAVMSFTSAPLRVVTILGLITMVFAFFVVFEAMWSWFNGKTVSGFLTLIITLLLTSSFIMISLGIIGEYLAKVYDEIKFRPPYLIEASIGYGEDQISEKSAQLGPVKKVRRNIDRASVETTGLTKNKAG
jgi:glycosyltransferase involved in cell wall biosynthesis